MDLTHSMESSMPKVIPALLVSEHTMPKEQLVLESCLLDHQTSQVCHLKVHLDGYRIFGPSRAPKSSAKIKSPNSNEPEEISLIKSISGTNETA
ncbi:unnamed protein product [Hymenolepis diminuta]|uniref:Ovule protein n=1 Tax=Hymenolepis diminuta TaxID=6216 RepID=A0A0R3SZD0_HYMDI|nr:unnamed protein product [Hymenolepis diminuta]VUZ56916.1 unnamed protein product [Hymenolepis diminuta]